MRNPIGRIPGEDAERYIARRAKWQREWIWPIFYGLIGAIVLKVLGFY